jgi:hypothetical protein
MVNSFFRLLITVVIFLSLAGKAMSQDFCDDSKVEQSSSVVQITSSNDFSDASDCQDCMCHCHHSHLDFAFIDKSFNVTNPKVKNFSLEFSSSLPLQDNSPQKPPKIVS